MAPIRRELFGSFQSAIETRLGLEGELAEHSRRDDPELSALQKELKDVEQRQVADNAAIEEEEAAARQAIQEDWSREREDSQREFDATVRETVRSLDDEATALERQHADSAWVVSSVMDDTADDSPVRQQERFLGAVARSRNEHTLALEAATRRLHELAESRGHQLSQPPAQPSSAGTDEETHAEFIQQINAADEMANEMRRLVLPRFFVGWRPLGFFLGLLIVFFLIAFFSISPSLVGSAADRSSIEWMGIVGAIAAVAALPLILVFYMLASMAQSEVFGRWQQHIVNARYLSDRWEAIIDREVRRREPQTQKLQAELESRREATLERYRDTFENRIAEIRARREAALADAHAQRSRRQSEADALQSRLLSDLETQSAAKTRGNAEAGHAAINDLKTRIADRLTARQREQSALWSKLKLGWEKASTEFVGAIENSITQSNERFLPWAQLAERDAPLPRTIPEAIRIGEFAVDLNDWPGAISTDMRLAPRTSQFKLPAVLPFPERPSLLLKSQSPAGRAAALPILQSAMLRLLTLLPPGTLRFTLLDPVGLGDSFAGLMHLADVDEMLVTSRIWTEPSQIEARLADLTEHMENVLQTYLRNEFPTLEDYNRHAGEVAEPYRVLVIRDFPAKFSEIAARRLTSIVTSGPRCGVYTLMSVDGKLQMPNNFNLSDIEAEMNVFEWREKPRPKEAAWDWLSSSAASDSQEPALAIRETEVASESDPFEPGYYSSDPTFSRWRLNVDAPPDADVFSRIVKRCGAASKGARRVEVSFERIAPATEERWTHDSRKGIDVPMGRAGAVKLQHVRLGQGTSQHMLIAGKTGSGKSTFLHGLITNLALHYGPDELQFFLIDFKKGVEFKDYAQFRLPHARVIAIESDREFGVSALTRLDELMQERGELFRRKGVQDVAGFRAANPDTPLPRILLVIDEFQEFFVEDDKYSQTAALLLDRLVRQGRAFGVHVILGSQTLGGAYSLARSTLGQVAVRVALQCSEADAHLILSEENTAARLLTRPGEAIYNDANGLVEGNHPFQIAWLPDDKREQYLRDMQEMAVRRGLAPESMIVFEGNIPSDLSRNASLRRLIDGEAAGRITSPLMWLGDAVEIGDPTSVKLERRTSTNVLIVGQDTEPVQGVLASAALALSLQSAEADSESPTDDAPAAPLLWLFDGSSADDPVRELWRKLENVVGSRMRVVTPSEASEAIAALRAELALRESSRQEVRPTIVIVVYNVSRFRDLRKSDDDFGFGSYGDKDQAASPAKQFSELLANGPELGMHSIIWADSYNNVERWFSRQALRDFELRILFPMNAADSSNLIDSPMASRLGPGRAILYREDRGSIEKFRPYAVPTDDLLDAIAPREDDHAAVELATDLDEFRVM